MASQITSHTIIYSTVYSGADQRKYQSSVSLACEGNSPVTGEFPHKWPVTRKMFKFDDVILKCTKCKACFDNVIKISSRMTRLERVVTLMNFFPNLINRYFADSALSLLLFSKYVLHCKKTCYKAPASYDR